MGWSQLNKLLIMKRLIEAGQFRQADLTEDYLRVLTAVLLTFLIGMITKAAKRSDKAPRVKADR
jgi:hypothetical protein